MSWRYPFHVARLEEVGIPAFPLINLWDGEDDQIDSLRSFAAEAGFRRPIIGNLFRDGGEVLVSQIDEFVEAVAGNENEVRAQASNKGLSVVDTVRKIAKTAYGVPAERVIFKDGFEQSLAQAAELVSAAGGNIDDLAVVAVKSPATMTDNDSLPEEERTVTLKKVEVRTGAGLVHVNLTTSLTTPMPKIV